MSSLNKMFSSSLGKKVIMSLTGLFLCLFLVIHLLGNFQLLKADDGFAFNSYTKFMTTNPLIKIASYITYLAILFHAIRGLLLVKSNRDSRKSKYVVDGSWANSHWTSRYMGVLGTIVLAFIVIHLSDFWYEMKFGDLPQAKYIHYEVDGESMVQPYADDFFNTIKPEVKDKINFIRVEVYKDLYKEVNTTFHEWWYVLIYVLSMLAISFHLWHGFKSAFQTLGINHPTYNKFISNLGYAFAVLIPAGFAIIPLLVYFGS